MAVSSGALERLEDAVERPVRMSHGVTAAPVEGAEVPSYSDLRLEEWVKPATINRELAALRAGVEDRVPGGGSARALRDQSMRMISAMRGTKLTAVLRATPESVPLG